MKFEGSIIINQSIDKVTALFNDPKYLKEYQEGFVRKELVSGMEGQNGAISKMYYQHGKREMILKETVRSNQLPHSFEAFYEHRHMDNIMKCSFIKLDDHTTKYQVEVQYTRINWVLPRLMALLFPNMYKKPARRWMENFKRLAEKYE
ncbi:MAG: SRPBCC family protein [Cyclobacteriaceae bacterium]|nr:SRPBCC family protein [Cyclobacteriaceae bacterium HetDA_MAG_MS6]